MLKLLSKLPLCGLYLISDVLFVVVYYAIGYRKKLVWKNLKNSFPDKTDKELKQIQKQFYHNLCDQAVETLKLYNISADELKKRMMFKNVEVLQPFATNNQSVLLLASHLFNWEWLLASGSLLLPIKTDFVYQEQQSKFFNDFVLRVRTRFGAYPIKREAVGKESLKRKGQLRGIAMVADQFPGQWQNRRFWTNFLNQQTAFFQGTGQLAALLHYPAFFSSVRRLRRGYYEAELIFISPAPADTGNEMIEAYAKALEKSIRENPSGWLWSHNRWKDLHGL